MKLEFVTGTCMRWMPIRKNGRFLGTLLWTHFTLFILDHLS